jgi:hypothetical protein
MWKDPIVEEIHEIRRRRAEKYNYDARAIGKAIQEEQRKSGTKYVTFSPKRVKPKLEESHK